MKPGYVYILTNKYNTVLYTGVSSDLKRRIYQHRSGYYPGISHKYNVDKLVYFEHCDDIRGAIEREKQIKNYSREKKLELIRLVPQPCLQGWDVMIISIISLEAEGDTWARAQ